MPTMATCISFTIIVSIVSFMFGYFFTEMFESFVSYFPSMFGRTPAAPANILTPQQTLMGQQSSLHSRGTFISTLISSTIITTIVSFLVVHFFPKMFESFLSKMFDSFFSKMFESFFSKFGSTVSWTAEKANYFRSLEHNLKALDDALDGLLAFKEKVISKVNAAEENPNLRLKEEVTLWLQKVTVVETKEVLALKGEIECSHLGGFFSKINLKSRYEFGKKVANLKQEMTKLKDEGGNFKDDLVEMDPAALAINPDKERTVLSKSQKPTLKLAVNLSVGNVDVNLSTQLTRNNQNRETVSKRKRVKTFLRRLVAKVVH